MGEEWKKPGTNGQQPHRIRGCSVDNTGCSCQYEPHIMRHSRTQETLFILQLLVEEEVEANARESFASAQSWPVQLAVGIALCMCSGVCC